MKFIYMIFPLIAIAAFLVTDIRQADAATIPGPKVSQPLNKHNLSASNAIPGFLYKATDDPSNNPRGQEICIFCHTPHNANVAGQAPLWNRAFSNETFQRYTGSSTFKIKSLAAAQYGPGAQPNGSSKLCLSCHDGVSSLGTVKSGPAITMVKDVITDFASFKPSTNKMRYGHHPVSFVYATGYNYVSSPIESQTGTRIAGLPADYLFPQLIDGKVKVKLKNTFKDGNGWMQCTTCHDAHQNQSDDDDCYGGACGAASQKKAPFWVSHSGTNTASQDRDAVCTACHSLTGSIPAQWLQ